MIPLLPPPPPCGFTIAQDCATCHMVGFQHSDCCCGCHACLEQSAVTTSSSAFSRHFQMATQNISFGSAVLTC